MAIRFKNNMSLSQKVTVSFVVIVIMLIAFLIGVFWQNWNTNKRYDNLSAQILQRTNLQKIQVGLQYDLAQIINDTRLAASAGSDVSQTILQKRIQDFSKRLVELQRDLSNQGRFATHAFQLEIQNINLKKLINRSDFDSNDFIYFRQIQIDVFEMFAEMDQMLTQDLESQRAKLSEDEEKNLNLSILLLAVCLLVIVSVMVKTTRQIHQTIAQLLDFTENISRGQITHKLPKKGDTDLDMLISAFNNMSENLSMASEILDERDQLKDEFVSVVSHEIRTPIAILQRVIENMRSGVAGTMTAEQENLIKIAENNVLRLSHLIKNLLDMARLESRKMQMKPTAINLREILQDLHLGFAELAKKDNLEVVVKAEPTLPNNFADSELVIQVITNLFNNALRFAKSKIVIEAKVHTLRGKPAIQVGVKDDGPGISLENQKKLFQKFVQINRQSTGQGYKGTGLGLAICKQIVEQHGGIIGVLSKPPEGSEFYFILPQS